MTSSINVESFTQVVILAPYIELFCEFRYPIRLICTFAIKFSILDFHPFVNFAN